MSKADEALVKVLRIAEQFGAVYRSGKPVRPAMWSTMDGLCRVARDAIGPQERIQGGYQAAPGARPPAPTTGSGVQPKGAI